MNAPLAAQLGVRFLLGLGMLAIGHQVAWDLLARAGAIAPVDAGTRVEASMLAFSLTAVGVAAFAAWQRPGLPWRPLRAGPVAASYLPFVVVWSAVLVGYLAFARSVGLDVPPQPALEYLAGASPARPAFWIVVAGIVVAAPVAEEIVFRGYLQCALADRLRPWLAIAITAAVFGAVHTLPYAFPIGLVGAFFGVCAWRSGSLLPAIFAHALHNGLTVAVTVLWPQSLTLLYPR